jgi:putative cardiolipin synthase
MKRTVAALFFLYFCAPPGLHAAAEVPLAFIDAQIAAHPGKSGVYVLEAAEEALIARAWLADQARRSIEVQYFIWSTDNIGILAAEAMLRAAERGVRVRIIVDDLLIDAPDESLLALSMHPNIDIRIYNPKSSVGVPLHTRIWNALSDFRGLNQRMHDKTFIVDGRIAITGGRNMAAEYFDYDHEYNFRDRDALLVGDVVETMQASFGAFWDSKLSEPVEELYDGLGLMQKNVQVADSAVRRTYEELHAYARSPENLAPQVKAAIEATPTAFPRLAQQIVWSRAEFVSDRPGKNNDVFDLDGGGRSTAALARLIENARTRIVIQSPYLVMSEPAVELFRRARSRGVRILINTNSLAATDNLQAFSGYRSDRERLLELGLEIHEYRPDPRTQIEVMQRELLKVPLAANRKPPIFGLHAKTMVVDSQLVYIGTFNLDPRSENLNTEVGVIVHDAALAASVETQMELDMKPGNSWNAATDDPDRYASLIKRFKVWCWQLLPLKPLL